MSRVGVKAQPTLDQGNNDPDNAPLPAANDVDDVTPVEPYSPLHATNTDKGMLNKYNDKNDGADLEKLATSIKGKTFLKQTTMSLRTLSSIKKKYRDKQLILMLSTMSRILRQEHQHFM